MRGGVEPARGPVGSTWLVDERGILLKATWRLDHGFINVSLWRDDRCVETFHLAPTEAASLVGFLVSGLAEVATVHAAAPVISLVPDPPATRPRRRDRAAAWLHRAADRVSR
jgi:hypothetical protein